MENTKDLRTTNLSGNNSSNIANAQKANNSSDNSFASIVYDEISAAIGGNNGNQFLCLQIPGTILNADDYRFDSKESSSKPLVIEANESRLANKMFDPCRMTSSDNGFSLPYQYASALDTLSPKLNRTASNVKNKLRQLLLSEYPYDFGDGVETKYTLQQVYFRLYNEYIEALNEWSKIQNQKKEELRQLYPLTQDYNEAYLDWYETESERHLVAIDEKKARVLSVFSPNDMKILEGVLDCGCGAELQESRQTLRHFRKLTPTGGYVYPVRFSPQNWFEMIGSSFTQTDLVKNPEKLADDFQDYSSRRMQLCSYIESIASLLIGNNETEDASYPKAYFAVTACKEALNHAEEEALNNLLNFKITLTAPYIVIKNLAPKLSDEEVRKIKKVLVSLTEIRSAIGTSLTKAIIFKLADRANMAALADVLTNKFITDEDGKISLVMRKRKDYVDAITVLIEELKIRLKLEQYSSFVPNLAPVITQLESINKKIPLLLEDLKYSVELQLDISDNVTSKSLTPDGFTQVEISADMQSLESDTQYTTSKSVTTKGLGFVLMGRKRITTTSGAKSSESLFEHCKVKITMNVAKIGIERDWFNPGIFAMTRNMIKMGNTQISPPGEDYEGITEQRLHDMRNCIFPCYPVAMVLARDVSISFEFNEKISSLSEQYRIIEQQALSGSGFLMFRNMTGNSTMQGSCSHVSMSDKSIVVKIDSTQLIGYYLEATRPDLSVSFEAISKRVRETENVSSISDFAGEYKSMLNNNIPRTRDTGTSSAEGAPESATTAR